MLNKFVFKLGVIGFVGVAASNGMEDTACLGNVPYEVKVLVGDWLPTKDLKSYGVANHEFNKAQKEVYTKRLTGMFNKFRMMQESNEISSLSSIERSIRNAANTK